MAPLVEPSLTVLDWGVLIAAVGAYLTVLKMQWDLRANQKRLEREVYGDEHDVRDGLVESNRALEQTLNQQFARLERNMEGQHKKVERSVRVLANQFEDPPDLPIDYGPHEHMSEYEEETSDD